MIIVIKNLIDRNEKLITTMIGIGIFFLGFRLFFANPFYIGYDLGGYLTIAKNFSEGLGMVDGEGKASLHRMGYKLLLSSLLGYGEENGIYLIAIFQASMAAFFLSGVYALGVRLFTINIGIATTLLLATNFYLVSSIPSKGLDVVWAAFIIWSLVLYLNNGVTKIRIYGMAILAGFLVAIAFWIKEMGAIFFLPVPILFWIFKIYPDQKFKPVVFYISAIIGILIGYCVYLMIQSNMAGVSYDISAEKNTIQSAFQSAQNIYSQNSIISLILFFLDGIRRYLFYINDNSGLSATLSIVYLFPIAFAAFLLKNRFKQDNDKAVWLILLSYLPFVVWAGQWNMRIEAILIVVAIIVILSVAVIFRAMQEFSIGGWVVIIMLSLMQTSKTFPVFYGEEQSSKLFSSVSSKSFSHIALGYEFKDRLSERIEAGQSVMFSDVMNWHSLGRVFGKENLLYLGPYQTRTPGIQANPYVKWANLKNMTYGYDVVSLNFYPKSMRFGEVYLVSGTRLKMDVKNKNIRYLFLSNEITDGQLLKWIQKHKNIKEEKVEKKVVHVGLDPYMGKEEGIDQIGMRALKKNGYIIEFLPGFSDEPNPEGCFIDEKFIDYLQELKAREERVLEWYKNNIFITAKGMTNDQFFSMLETGTCPK